MTEREPRPESRQEFAPTGEPADLRSALRVRAPRCGIGVALFVALLAAALWAGADGPGLLPATVVLAALLVAAACVVLVLRQRRRAG